VLSVIISLSAALPPQEILPPTAADGLEPGLGPFVEILDRAQRRKLVGRIHIERLIGRVISPAAGLVDIIDGS